jgi:hypothetical protein
MQLGEIIRDFSDGAKANEALLSCGDLTLIARIGETAGRYDETVGEYASGAIGRFANLASNEDWLAVMNKLERTDDPALSYLLHVLDWSLKRDAAEANASQEANTSHQGCTCGGHCA